MDCESAESGSDEPHSLLSFSITCGSLDQPCCSWKGVSPRRLAAALQWNGWSSAQPAAPETCASLGEAGAAPRRRLTCSSPTAGRSSARAHRPLILHLRTGRNRRSNASSGVTAGFPGVDEPESLPSRPQDDGFRTPSSAITARVTGLPEIGALIGLQTARRSIVYEWMGPAVLEWVRVLYATGNEAQRLGKRKFSTEVYCGRRRSLTHGLATALDRPVSRIVGFAELDAAGNVVSLLLGDVRAGARSIRAGLVRAINSPLK